MNDNSVGNMKLHSSNCVSIPRNLCIYYTCYGQMMETSKLIKIKETEKEKDATYINI
jgi:hypothetical protein